MRTENITVKVSDDIVYRPVQNELVLIEVNSGSFFYFSPESREFFDSLREPRQVDASDVVDMLLEKQILVKCEATAPQITLPLPQFLRMGEQKLEDVRFLY